MIQFRSVYIILLALLSTMSSDAATVTLKKNPSREKSSLAAHELAGTTLIAATALFDLLGYRWQWEPMTQRLISTNNTTRMSFVQDNLFCTINENVVQMPLAPMRRGGTLYIPIETIVHVLNAAGNRCSWSATSKTLEVTTDHKTILSVVCDQKQNGTLLTIVLADSLPFDYTYFHPNLLLNFFGGTIDTQLIRNSNRVGIVKSLSAVQFKGSAQVSVVLTREIEDPLIDYVQDTRTVMVSLRPQKTQLKKTNQQSLPSSLPMQGIKTIVIDPGHGGKDPGAIGPTGVQEKTVVLGIALQLRDLLKKKPGFTVHLTRDTDVFIPLSERTKIANDKKADLFISIHADAVPGNAKRKEATKGYKIYFLSQAKNEEDKLVAMRENAVIELEEKPQNYSNLQNVLIDLAGNEYLRESQDLCIMLDQKFNSGLSKQISKLHLGVGQANFWVLNGAYMPSVLVEAGFLSNPAEEKLLSDKSFQKKMAQTIYEAIVSFSEKYETGL